ncbi:MAG: 50S ribosomal protein L13 [Candidatus Altiarchaeota archaeon]
MIVDADGLILGRLASFVVKKALKGETIIIVNAEKAVISGKKEDIIGRNLAKLEIKNKGNYRRGPFHYRRPDRYVRKSIRGMLPTEKTRGQEAFKKIMVYIGFPKEVIAKKQGIDASKEKLVKPKVLSKNLNNYLTVGELCKAIGGSF